MAADVQGGRADSVRFEGRSTEIGARQRAMGTGPPHHSDRGDRLHQWAVKAGGEEALGEELGTWRIGQAWRGPGEAALDYKLREGGVVSMRKSCGATEMVRPFWAIARRVVGPALARTS